MKVLKFGFSHCILGLSILFTACGGGGSSGSTLLIEGTLTEAGEVEHSLHITPKHSAGERIENVAICALGECSTTDGQGQWGFEADELNVGGDVLFSVQGHGIDTDLIVSIPSGAKEVFLDLQHVTGGKVEAHHITIDGEVLHNEDQQHQHE